MARINLLERQVSELIAAGEVIERPASVVKELVENAIDAGATAITVELKRGGISFIRVTDNGCGIDPEDVPTAFLRHATSKVKSAEDLDSIATLGFRGEALASISAVARVEIITKTRQSQYGVRLNVQGQEYGELEQTGCPDGTTIIVRDLFYNTPARLKFLKKDVSEGNAIANIVDKIALSHPEVSVKLIRDNKQELLTPGDGDLYAAIYAVFGRSFAQTLLPVDYTYEGIRITGFACKPLQARGNRTMQHFFVNGRYIRARICTVALEEAYKGKLLTGKFPACVLNLHIPHHLVDVNAHPTKTEVRFSNEKIVFDSMYFVIKNALMQGDTPREIALDTPKESQPLSQQAADEPVTPAQTSSTFTRTTYEVQQAFSAAAPQAEQIALHSPIAEYKVDTEKEFKYIDSQALTQRVQPQSSAPKEVVTAEPLSPRIYVIGEIFDLYILAQAEDALVLIDKHAAHERILFESFRAQSEERGVQVLLTPVELTLTKDELGVLEQSQDILTELGFRVEQNGAQAQVLEAPAMLSREDAGDLVAEIATKLMEHRRDPAPDLMDDLYHSMACKAAIRAGDKSGLHELQALAEQVYQSEDIRYCPHGRPVMTTLSKRELEKFFNR